MRPQGDLRQKTLNPHPSSSLAGLVFLSLLLKLTSLRSDLPKSFGFGVWGLRAEGFRVHGFGFEA